MGIMTRMNLSAQINYMGEQCGSFTWTTSVHDVLTSAKNLHDKGYRVGTVALYVYPKRGKARAVAIWTFPGRDYFGFPSR